MEQAPLLTNELGKDCMPPGGFVPPPMPGHPIPAGLMAPPMPDHPVPGGFVPPPMAAHPVPGGSVPPPMPGHPIPAGLMAPPMPDHPVPGGFVPPPMAAHPVPGGSVPPPMPGHPILAGLMAPPMPDHPVPGGFVPPPMPGHPVPYGLMAPPMPDHPVPGGFVPPPMAAHPVPGGSVPPPMPGHPILAGLMAPPMPDHPVPGGFVPPPMPGYPVPGGFVPPPMPADPVPQPEPAHIPQEWNIPPISEETAREAFVEFASSHCCYSNKPARDGVITNMEPFDTYRFCLETFTEARSTAWIHEPYKGQRVDANTQGPPTPWAVAAKNAEFFTDDEQVIKMPYTSSVQNCHDCMGLGKKTCEKCSGTRQRKCLQCNGGGRPRYTFEGQTGDICPNCNGSGRLTCSGCDGSGYEECDTCDGMRQLLVFMNLTVTWENNMDEYVVEIPSGLTEEKLSEVYGKELFKDTQLMVYPVMGFPEPKVVSAAQRLVNEHQAKFSQTGRILQQRQTIDLIPITKVTYSWKDDSHEYYVYGNENEISDDAYPDKCACCCCTIM